MAANFNKGLRNPRQAHKVFATGRYYAKQKHQYIVKFTVNDATQANLDTIKNLTFVAKMVDRPKIDPKTEELHQYNKRRQIYTGLKYQPLRIQFYDDGNGRAMRMWQDYATYYFGDFIANKNSAYTTDSTDANFDSDGKGFGLTMPGGGMGSTAGGQFYFQNITITHIYDAHADVYTLTNPRISLFEPDDLNYEEAAVSLISMTIVYENLQYELQSTTALQQDDEIFATGQPFDGDVIEVNDGGTPRQIKTSVSDLAGFDERLSLPTPNYAPSVGIVPTTNQFRFNGTPSTGSVGMFGDYQFGPTMQANLGMMALNSFPLAAALNMALTGNPLALAVPMASASNMSRLGIDGAAYDVAQARAGQGSSGYGNTVGQVVIGMLASAAMRGASSVRTPSGLVLTPESYRVMNSRQTGTAQYGYNNNTAPDGTSWGYTGAAGYQGPFDYTNDGPYAADRPAGLSGRAGIQPEPLPDYNNPGSLPDYN